MGILLDIGFVIIILLCVVFGYKKGFFKSIAGFIGAVIAMFLAWVLAGLIANALYQGVFREKLIDNISSVLSNDALASFPEKAAQVVANLPGFLSNTLNNQGITSSQIEQSLQAAGSNAAPATADLISPAVIWLLQLLLTVILFFILVILVRLVIKLIGNVFRLPILRQVDGILGGLFGILFRPMDCKIISTLISFAANFVKILNASPGLSGTPMIDTRATSLSFAIPLINISSILFASLTIVPGFLLSWKALPTLLHIFSPSLRNGYLILVHPMLQVLTFHRKK